MKNLLLIITALLIASSCKGPVPLDGKYNETPGTATPTNANIKFLADLDGNPFTADLVTAVQTTQSSTGFTTHFFTIKGETDSGDFIQIALNSTQEKIGTGLIDLSNLSSQGMSLVITYKMGSGAQESANPVGVIGEINIMDMTEDTIAGTFNMEFTQLSNGQTSTINNGSFRSDNYAERNI